MKYILLSCILLVALTTANGQDYAMINDGYISSINDRSIRYSIEKSNKKAKWLYRLIMIHNQSVMINEDAKISIKIDHDAYLPQKAGLFVDIENNTDELLFLDLGTCFFRKNNRATSYFLNSSTTTTSGYASGWSFGSSTIGNILGLNGTVFNRASFGGGIFNSKSTTVYAERIVAIVPHTKYTLPLKLLYETKAEKPYRTDFKLGERCTYQQPEKIEESPWEIILSYAKESDLDKMKRMRVAMYVAEELSVPSLWKDGIENESEEAPLHYYYKVK